MQYDYIVRMVFYEEIEVIYGKCKKKKQNKMKNCTKKKQKWITENKNSFKKEKIFEKMHHVTWNIMNVGDCLNNNIKCCPSMQP